MIVVDGSVGAGFSSMSAVHYGAWLPWMNLRHGWIQCGVQGFTYLPLMLMWAASRINRILFKVLDV